MLGHFYIQKEDNKKYHSYSNLYDMNEKQRDDFLKSIKNETILCGCKEEYKIQMRVVSPKGNKCYLRTNKGQKELHSKHCNWFGSSFQSNNILGIKKELSDTGFVYYLNLANNYFNIATPDTSKLIAKVNIKDVAIYYNLLSWESYIKNKRKLPLNLTDFFKYSYGKSNSIFLDKERSLSINDILYSPSKFKSMGKHERFFIYMILKENPIKILKSNFYLLKLYNPIFESTVIDIYCKEDFIKNVLADSDNKKDGISQVLISGVVRKNCELNRLEFEEFNLLRITNKGLFGKNKEERACFNYLQINNRLFFKPIFSIYEYGNNVPSFIILDSRKNIIGDIFLEDISMNDKVRKITAGEKMLDYEYWFWDLLYNKKMPLIF